MVIINLLGIVMAAAGFGIAYGVGTLLGSTEEDLIMIIGGPIITIADLGYRLRSRTGHWFQSDGGGSLFFLPMWLFGLFWLGLGTVRYLQV